MREKTKSMRRIHRLLFVMLVAGILLSMPIQSFAGSKKAKAAIKAYKKMLEQEKIYVVPANTLFIHEEFSGETIEEVKKELREYDIESIGYKLEHEYDDGEDYWSVYGVRLKYSKSEAVEFSLAYIDKDSVPELLVHRKASKGCECFGVFFYKKGKVVRADLSKVDKDDWFNLKIIGYFKNTGIIRLYPFQFNDDGSVRIYYKVESGKSKNPKYSYIMSYSHDGNSLYVKNKKVSKPEYQNALREITSGKKMTKVKWYANTEKNRKKHLK